MRLHLPATLVALGWSRSLAFAPPSTIIGKAFPLTQDDTQDLRTTPSTSALYASIDDDEDDEDGLDSLIGKKLGIDIGSQLPSLSPEEIADIKVAAQATLDEAIDGRLAEIQDLREELQNELSESRQRMNVAAELNVQLEKQSLMNKIDQISDKFLSENSELRASTKRVAEADAKSSGRGVQWGSWGTLDDGEVVISPTGIEGPTKLLGSIDAARRKEQLLRDSGDGFIDDMPALVNTENRVLVIVDENKDKGSKQVIEQLTALLKDVFDSDISIETYSPASNIPMGGNNAQTAIVFASSLNDRSSLENVLSRVLKRTAPVAGGMAGTPPSHVVLISSLGTERTNKMPYSMQNLFGGKLDKVREIELALVSISRGRKQGTQTPLDYTIVKLGDIVNSDGDYEADVKILPGDKLDGEIGVNAAANVLLQAMAYQPYARNSTLCAAGSMPADSALDAAAWNDMFLCLSGPELLRIEAGSGTDVKEALFDPKFEQLAEYVQGWSTQYEGDRKGTGLTTPVLVRRSRKPSASEIDGVAARQGIRILFQSTNTGDRYKSASEEKADEKERSGGGTTTRASPTKLVGKPSKEGGVEVLIEKTTGGTIRVRARRCNMGDKTIVKEMSEEVIVKNLKRAVTAWVEAR